MLLWGGLLEHRMLKKDRVRRPNCNYIVIYFHNYPSNRDPPGEGVKEEWVVRSSQKALLHVKIRGVVT